MARPEGRTKFAPANDPANDLFTALLVTIELSEHPVGWREPSGRRLQKSLTYRRMLVALVRNRTKLRNYSRLERIRPKFSVDYGAVCRELRRHAPYTWHHQPRTQSGRKTHPPPSSRSRGTENCSLVPTSRHIPSPIRRSQSDAARWLARLVAARDKVALMVAEDPVYAPIFARLDREVALERARQSGDPLERARAIVAQKAIGDSSRAIVSNRPPSP
ncbi:hypothetical protein SAMN05216224_106240 [Thioclava dalianensis]|nr:hypothetical protein SAMN05216224_106240 [Thioclava dalianensis]